MNQAAMYLVYDHPAAYPQGFEVRRMWTSKGSVMPEAAPFARGETLEAVRAEIPDNAERLPAMPDDRESVVEVWI